MSMKAVELKEILKKLNLRVAGKKSELIERIVEFYKNQKDNLTTGTDLKKVNEPAPDDLDAMTLKDLKDACIAREIRPSGSKKELLERLRQDIQMTKEMRQNDQSIGRDECIALSRLIEEKMVKSEPVASKFVNVKITSLKLEPEKYTAGGAPSVTADVIRKLAGEPFADPPKYGTVS
jgi:SAP domain